MKTFLEYVAKDIISKYGTDLSQIAVVFPNKRASLFLNDALARQAGAPLWSPAYITISELFRRHSPLQIADPIKLVCDLHRSYTEVTGFDETLDNFYGWGQLLVSDFDDIDKHIAPADRIFANLRDIREFDDISYLTEEQKAVIRKFFSNFSDDHNTLLKERFLRLWSKMGDIYHNYNRRLSSQGLAYEGALYRQVAGSADIHFEHSLYLFIGFNLLQPVEERLFTLLKKEGKARFYWDFDRYYLNSEAGRSIQQSLQQFPNEFDTRDEAIYQNFSNPKHISLISAPTDDTQARFIGQWLNSERISAGRHTAIVLCNEGLLQTVIHQLPPAVTSVNITTGYPLQQTPVASLVLGMLRDHTLTQIIERIKQLAKDTQGKADPLRAESLFRAYTLLNRLQALVSSGDIPPQAPLLQSLATQLIRQASIPFHGEPAEGLQVMGVLETRNLDFDHLLLLSAGEGNLPQGTSNASFIPYSLRRAFGLTTADHKSAIYAYYFNRLISRPTDITFVYSNTTNDRQSGEMSRYILQLLVEDKYHTIERHTLQTGQLSRIQHPHSIEKSAAVQETLRRRFAADSTTTTPKLTPTAINHYMRCPLQFYYCYVEGLREPDDTEDGVIDNRVFGNIFHNAAQLLYEQLAQLSIRRPITAVDLDELLKDEVSIERAVDQAFSIEFNGHAPTGGLAVINREVIIHYLHLLIETDRKLTPFTIMDLEKEVMQTMPIRSAGIKTTIGGRIDRLDCINTPDGGQQIRVIDYKTSAARLKALKTVDDIFDDKSLRNHSDYYLQTMLYARIVNSQYAMRNPQLSVAPALLFIQHTATDDFNPVLKFGNEYINTVATPDGNRFVELLIQKVNNIFDPALPFRPTDDNTRCSSCPYRLICGNQ